MHTQKAGGRRRRAGGLLQRGAPGAGPRFQVGRQLQAVGNCPPLLVLKAERGARAEEARSPGGHALCRRRFWAPAPLKLPPPPNSFSLPAGLPHGWLARSPPRAPSSSTASPDVSAHTSQPQPQLPSGARAALLPSWPRRLPRGRRARARAHASPAGPGAARGRCAPAIARARGRLGWGGPGRRSDTAGSWVRAALVLRRNDWLDGCKWGEQRTSKRPSLASHWPVGQSMWLLKSSLTTISPLPSYFPDSSRTSRTHCLAGTSLQLSKPSFPRTFHDLFVFLSLNIM